MESGWDHPLFPPSQIKLEETIAVLGGERNKVFCYYRGHEINITFSILFIDGRDQGE